MSSTRTRSPEPDQACAEAVDLARAAAVAVAGQASVGEHVGFQVEGERVLTHLFDCLDPAYRGWRWAVTVARAPRAKAVTVDETVLLPGAGSLLAPPWVPWQDRLRPGDLGVGDLLPAAPDDERLVPLVLIDGDDGVTDWYAADEPGVDEPGVDEPGMDEPVAVESFAPGPADRADSPVPADPPVGQAADQTADDAADQSPGSAVDPGADPAGDQAADPLAEQTADATADQAETPDAGQDGTPAADQTAVPAASEATAPGADQAAAPGADQAAGATASQAAGVTVGLSAPLPPDEIAYPPAPGRSRVLSALGRADAAERWYTSEHGPRSPLAHAAPAKCATCGFYVALSGELGGLFGACANAYAPDDGRVVSADHGCGAHSEAVAASAATRAISPVIDEFGYDLVDLPGISVEETVFEPLSRGAD